MKKLKIAIALLIILAAGSLLFYFKYATILSLFHRTQLTAGILDRSIKLSQQYMLSSQLPDGTFNYEYNFITDSSSTATNQVRQAGAFWGVTLLHTYLPTTSSEKAIDKTIDFIIDHSRIVNQNIFLLYPSNKFGKTGTISLICLGLIEYLKSSTKDPKFELYRTILDGYIKQLIHLRKDNGLFYANYDYYDGHGYGRTSPYYDGETLLALSKYAAFTKDEPYQNMLLQSADTMYQNYVVDALKKDRDSNRAKGFFQWGSMAFYEIYNQTKGENWAKRTIEMSHWMIDVHRTLWRSKNTAYAHEGMAVAWELARLTQDESSQKKIGTVIDIGLKKLISWQVSGPMQNSFLIDNQPQAELAIGGIMNAKNDPVLRIDVTQHQAHAMILAKNFIYSK